MTGLNLKGRYILAYYLKNYNDRPDGGTISTSSKESSSITSIVLYLTVRLTVHVHHSVHFYYELKVELY